jgi:hypothetical protein
MPTDLISKVIDALVTTLIERELVDLAEGVESGDLVAELVENLGQAPAFSQLGPFLSRAMLSTPLVDELYADDRTLVVIINQLRL